MQVNISGHHVEVTEALHDYVTKKLQRLNAHFEGITNVQATLSVEKLIHRAEATLHIKGADINATAESEDMYAAIDQLSDKLDRQLVKHKEKSLHHHQGAAGKFQA
ncbi:MAG: ribosome-associated translation inhibitor RaiA [Endozoicomonas sp. (ex Botrylloides leachii)]|nr:ribosome-associated translation inhibitor RaiA [Endozoicomonas sp. (ex Botrylloides leachii)]